MKNSLKQYIFPERTKYGSKKANIIFSVYQGVFGHFTTIYFRFPKATQHFRRLPKTLEDQRRGPTIDCQRCPKNPPSETENIIKLANLTANTKNVYGQITLNTKPIQTLCLHACLKKCGSNLCNRKQNDLKCPWVKMLWRTSRENI